MTINFSPSPSSKCCLIWKIVGSGGEVPGLSSSGVGTGANTGTPTVTTDSIPVGTVAIGMIALEGRVATHPVTGDADTTNGSWSTQLSTSAESGADLSSMLIASQAKVQTTTTSTQTYNPTFTAADCIPGWITIGVGGFPAPATIVTAVTMPAVTATASADATPTPAVIATPVTIDAVAAQAGQTAAPAAITVPVTMDPVSAFDAGSNATPTPAAIPVSTAMDAVAASGASNATPTPATIVTGTTHPAVTASGVQNASTSPAAIVVTTAMDAVVAFEVIQLTPITLTTASSLTFGTFSTSTLLPPLAFEAYATFDIVSHMRPTVLGDDGMRPQWRVTLVNNEGATEIALANAVPGEIKWSLNEPDSFTFILPTLDPATALITVPDQEVQCWWGDQIFFWGPIVRSMAGISTVEYQCRGVDWYLTKRIIGRPETNVITDPSFENPTTVWNWAVFSPIEPVDPGRDPSHWDSEVVNNFAMIGGRSVRQWSDDQMIFGIHTITGYDATIQPTEAEGIIWTAVAWAYVPSGDYVDPRIVEISEADQETVGLSLYRRSTTEFAEFTHADGVVSMDPLIYDQAFVPLDDDTPKDRWVRMEVSLTQPVDPAGARTDQLVVDLGTPIGVVFWDEVSLTRNERLYFNQIDQAVIAETIVTHAQDPAYGKSDLNIETMCPLTGVLRTRSYEFFNHVFAADAIEEFPNLWKGMDYSIELTAARRIFTTHYPMKGSRRPAQTLIIDKNIAGMSIPYDGEQVANRVIIQSDSGTDGSGREEAVASDPSGMASGLVLEAVFNAVKDSDIETLQDQANRALRQYRSPVVIPVITTMETPGEELLGLLRTGDVVPVAGTWGGIDMAGDYRIFEITIHPATETMDLVVNPFEEWNDPTRTWGVIV